MRRQLRAAVWRLAAVTTVCAVATVVLIMVFAQLRFSPTTGYQAVFNSVAGLESGQFVRVAGVEVGKVKNITVNDDDTATVSFAADDSVVLTNGTTALIRYENLIGDRYLELQEGAGGTDRLTPGSTIPLQRTRPALDLDALIGGFRPLFRALNPDQVNALSVQLVQVLQGKGATVDSFLAQTATLTSSLADRDELIGALITSLNEVLGSLAAQSDQFDKAVSSLSELVGELSARRTDISDSVGATDAAARSIADLLSQVRSPFADTVAQSDRVNGIIVADHEYVDNLLATLPDAYKMLGRQALNGDFYSYYVCDIVLKVNGKGGQPVYVKVAGQASGRCTPK